VSRCRKLLGYARQFYANEVAAHARPPVAWGRLFGLQGVTSIERLLLTKEHGKRVGAGSYAALAPFVMLWIFLGAATVAAQMDPSEPPNAKPSKKVLPPISGAISRGAVDETSLRSAVEELVACGTRHSLSSWDDPKRGIGCGRDRIKSRFEQIDKGSGGKLQISVDRFETTSPRTGGKPVRMENVIAILPGSDPSLVKTVFIVSGHYDSRASSPTDSRSDAPGADDDASGVAVALEAARLLSPGTYRATLAFVALAGEEQGLLGAKRLLAYFKENGYQIGGMLNNDIVGADFAPGSGVPHRVRVFSHGGLGNSGPDNVDPPSRELARAIEGIVGAPAVRLIFRLDRLGRGGDHRPFAEAGLPAVRFTEPLENYDHQHQTPRNENGREYGDLVKCMDFKFLGNVARVNAEALRVLAIAPAPPKEVTLAGGVTPDAKISWAAGDDAQREGFEILWRDTTESRWATLDSANSSGDVVLTGISTDNHFFAVRSVGKNGARSIAIPAVPKPPSVPSS